METRKIVLLAGKSHTTKMLYHKLNETFLISKVILEEDRKLPTVLKKRIKNYGIPTTIGQVLFKIVVEPVLKLKATSRIREIIDEHHLNERPIPPDTVAMVDSVNSAKTIKLLQQIKPDIVVVHGTRILSAKLLQAIPCKCMNIHAGITPKYRGVHGAYWALVNDDLSNCGVTIHIVDSGIDTGNIISQENIRLTDADNFCTYPYLQFAKGIELLIQGIHDEFSGKLTTKKAVGESSLKSHPTLWQYLYNRWKWEVK